jgi:hypothetical protein
MSGARIASRLWCSFRKPLGAGPARSSAAPARHSTPADLGSLCSTHRPIGRIRGREPGPLSIWRWGASATVHAGIDGKAADLSGPSAIRHPARHAAECPPVVFNWLPMRMPRPSPTTRAAGTTNIASRRLVQCGLAGDRRNYWGNSRRTRRFRQACRAFSAAFRQRPAAAISAVLLRSRNSRAPVSLW